MKKYFLAVVLLSCFYMHTRVNAMQEQEEERVSLSRSTSLLPCVKTGNATEEAPLALRSLPVRIVEQGARNFWGNTKVIARNLPLVAMGLICCIPFVEADEDFLEKCRQWVAGHPMALWPSSMGGRKYVCDYIQNCIGETLSFLLEDQAFVNQSKWLALEATRDGALLSQDFSVSGSR